MNIIALLDNPAKGSYYEKVANGQELDLNKIKSILDFFDKDKVTGFICSVGFTSANFLVVPTQLIVKPRKMSRTVIDGKYMDWVNILPTQFMTSDEVAKRATYWLDNWSKLRGRYLFVPTIIAPSEKGWIWCTNKNEYVPEKLNSLIQGDINEI